MLANALPLEQLLPLQLLKAAAHRRQRDAKVFCQLSLIVDAENPVFVLPFVPGLRPGTQLPSVVNQSEAIPR